MKKEHSVSNEILRKIVPVETNILNDPCIKVKVKFRSVLGIIFMIHFRVFNEINKHLTDFLVLNFRHLLYSRYTLICKMASHPNTSMAKI